MCFVCFVYSYVDTGRADGAKLHPITFYVKEKAEFIASCGVLLDEISTPGALFILMLSLLFFYEHVFDFK